LLPLSERNGSCRPAFSCVVKELSGVCGEIATT
jgi:hypothetical protein